MPATLPPVGFGNPELFSPDPFKAVFSPELHQYIAQRGTLRIVPTRPHIEDDAHQRADALCVVLNRLYCVADGAEIATWNEACD